MNLLHLVLAAVSYNDLAVRQMVKDAKREGVDWSTLVAPDTSHPFIMACAASVSEILAEHFGGKAPTWAEAVGESPQEFYFDSDVRVHPYLKRQSPTCFSKRRLYTYRNYLNLL